MFRARSVWLASLLATLWLIAPPEAGAQPVTQLKTRGTSGTIAANGDAVTLTNTGGLASLAIQTKDSYSGTWELQCSTDGGTTYDADDEVLLTLVGGTSTASSVTDTVGIWQANISGCTAVRVIATAGFAATDTTISMQAITSGGASGGGGAGSTFDGVLLDAAAGDAITDTANDALRVNVVAGAGSGGTAAADDADFTAGTTNMTPAGGFYQSTVTACTDGDTCAVGITSDRAWKTSLFSAAGTAAFGTAGTAATPVLTVQGIASMTPLLVGDGTGAFNVIVDSGTVTTVSTVTSVTAIGTSVTPGTSAGHLGKAEDAAHGSGDTGVAMLAVRQDTAAALAGTTGDYIPLTTTSLGAMRVDVASIGGASPAAAICDDPAKITTAAISTSSSGNVEIVALDGSDLIYICGYSVVAGAATGVQFIRGTGTACATGETDLTGVWSFAANGGITQANAGFPQFVVPAGNAFCIENSGANAVAGHVTYVQQP